MDRMLLEGVEVELEVEESDLRVIVDVMSFVGELSQPKRGSKVDRLQVR